MAFSLCGHWNRALSWSIPHTQQFLFLSPIKLLTVFPGKHLQLTKCCRFLQKCRTKFRPFDKVQTNWVCSFCIDFDEKRKFYYKLGRYCCRFGRQSRILLRQIERCFGIVAGVDGAQEIEIRECSSRQTALSQRLLHLRVYAWVSETWSWNFTLPLYNT